MLNTSKIWAGLAAGAAALAMTALAGATGALAQAKKAEDVHIVFVTHGQANDVYWSVVKNGVEAGQAAMGSKVEYHAPETFDMVQMARLIDAATASKPDALVVSIPDATALKDAVANAKAAGISVGVIDSGQTQVHDWDLDLWVGGGSEYNNGVRAGEIMGEAGVKHGLCVNQEVGNVSLDDRCNGFKDGLAKTGGTIEVVAVTMDPTEFGRPRRSVSDRQSANRRGARARARASPTRSCSGCATPACSPRSRWAPSTCRRWRSRPSTRARCSSPSTASST